MDIWILSTILLLTLYLLITEIISVDLTAIGIMVVLVVSRILTPRKLWRVLQTLQLLLSVQCLLFPKG
ncbi:hypothetical protein DGMP_33670 [Desulfomarina profundi]|uniref:Uncharacterized protein n=1 Tax=Desulfomarina profundi TaxID=2772557 RepID=A0A8D5JIG9_9BACT|nr:hypothetical protein [Desulfomarina profundi]BCL62674.1 hypothetical protein DGMP_33670 [Desulfomarina profundi]